MTVVRPEIQFAGASNSAAQNRDAASEAVSICAPSGGLPFPFEVPVRRTRVPFELSSPVIPMSLRNRPAPGITSASDPSYTSEHGLDFHYTTKGCPGQVHFDANPEVAGHPSFMALMGVKGDLVQDGLKQPMRPDRW